MEKKGGGKLKNPENFQDHFKYKCCKKEKINKYTIQYIDYFIKVWLNNL